LQMYVLFLDSKTFSVNYFTSIRQSIDFD